jgi:hypothetical protein
MVKIWRPGDNFCAFERISEMADLKKKIALMKKRQFFCYPTVHESIWTLVPKLATTGWQLGMAMF